MKKKKFPIFWFLVLLFVSCWFLFIYEPKESPKVSPPTTPSTTLKAPTIGQRTKTSDCKVNGPFPDKECTPGAIFPDVTAKDICTPGYAKKVRKVSASLKKAVYAEYGITHHGPGEYEVDHHISLELGGSNDIANLWPEAAEPRPGFHEKDKVENYLHKEVCSGKMPLQEAQFKIANDWLTVYQSITK